MNFKVGFMVGDGCTCQFDPDLYGHSEDCPTWAIPRLCGTPECPCGDPTLCGTLDPDDVPAVSVRNYRERIDYLVRRTS